MNRRSFLNCTWPLLVYGPLSSRRSFSNALADTIMTVGGEKPVSLMGFTLTHEHLFSIFGLDPEEKTEYDIEQLVSAVSPFLERAKAAGCNTIIDCTAVYFGRDVRVLKLLSEKSGLNIITNTGIYGAANGRYIPSFVQNETSRQIAYRWINEWKNGIDDSGIRPGFIKLGFNNGPLSTNDKKLLEAGALTHLECGLTIAAHTANNPDGAFQQLEVLKQNKVSPSAWIWTHAHDVPTNEPLLKAAEMGAWISFDGYKIEKNERFLDGLVSMKKNGFLGQVLLSHDGNGYPQKGKMPSRLTIILLTDFLPLLLQAGFTASEIRQLTVTNPAKAFAIKTRTLP